MGSCVTMGTWYRPTALLLFVHCNLGRVGPTGYVEYRQGGVGIVIAVPHGGTVDAYEIPDRKYGTVEGDDHTKELGEVVSNTICQALNKCPYLVISNLKRSKLDPNRGLIEAAQNNAKAGAAWQEYHGFIDLAKQREHIGVVIDLHGQSHRRNKTELGYLLSSSQLNRGLYNSAQSSVRALARRTGRSGKELMTGFLSLIWRGKDTSHFPHLENQRLATRPTSQATTLWRDMAPETRAALTPSL